MSNYTDFFPQGGTDLIPGVVQKVTDNYFQSAQGTGFLDINDRVLIDLSLYPELNNNLFVPNWSSTSLQQEINNPTPVDSDNFGKEISMYGDTLVVGAHWDDTGATNAGSVYVYVRSGTTWSLQQTINNPSPTSEDWFGISVSIYGDTLVVGANLDETGGGINTGSVYIYTRSGTTWSLQQTISNPTPVDADYFGGSVSLYGDTLVVGTSSDDTGATDAGSVYVYTRSGTTWSLQQTINNPSPVASDYFGNSVSLYGDTLVAAASQDDTGASNAGSVYVYVRSGVTWSLQQTINNPTPVVDDIFGVSICIYDDTLVIGASQDDTGATNAGSVYVYTRFGSTWSLQETISSLTPVASDLFGHSVTLYSDTLVVGAYQDDTGAGNTGSVYVYTTAEAGTFSIQAQDKVLKTLK